MSTSGMNDKAVVKGIELRADAAILGLQTAMPAGVTQLTVGGVTFQVADLVKRLQDAVHPWKAAREAHAIIRQTTQDRPKDQRALEGILADVKVSLASVLGRESEQLTRFGFKPQKRRPPLTSEQKVMRAAKAKLTREKRHTLGRRQKEELRQTEAPSVAISSDGAISIEAPPIVEPAKPAATTPEAPSAGTRAA